MAKKTILIQIPSCPYCKNARDALDKKGISYEILNVTPSDRSIVQALSGQPSVPILVEVIGSVNQDDDIIEYIS